MSGTKSNKGKKKQAVVLIHGVGEQVPMQTLQGFVDAVWVQDESLRDQNENATGFVWSKPDKMSASYELRRLTTAKNKSQRRTDFFELYWADQMQGTKLSDLLAWIKQLLFRNPLSVPRQFKALWCSVWGLALLVVVGMTLHKLELVPIEPGIVLLVNFLVGALWLALGGFFLKVAGDAARYLHVAPANIAGRRRVRNAGIELLDRIHESGKYDRIVLVGHSLGTVIGYDILTHLWPKYNIVDNSKAPAFEELFERAEALVSDESARAKDDFPDQFQELQSEMFEAFREQGSKWLVTDFVTLGSPLAHGAFLLARSEKRFKYKKSNREFPVCPPQLEKVRNSLRFRFPSHGSWIPHHAAVFAYTRWTNFYFPAKNTFWGDIIGGPVSKAFGRGIKDVCLSRRIRGGFFNHCDYWRLPESDSASSEHIEKLRQALRLWL